MADPVTQGILLAVTAASTVGSVYSQTKAAGASRRATQAQRRQEALAAAVQRRQTIKAGRTAQALALQAGENQGVAGPGSSATGAAMAIGTQTTANLSFLDKQGQLADYAGKMFDKSAKWQQTAAIFGGAAQLASVGYGVAQEAAASKARDELLAKNGIKI